jgi:hypothetical protein
LRHAAHKLILKPDPDAARKRKEAARTYHLGHDDDLGENPAESGYSNG